MHCFVDRYLKVVGWQEHAGDWDCTHYLQSLARFFPNHVLCLHCLKLHVRLEAAGEPECQLYRMSEKDLPWTREQVLFPPGEDGDVVEDQRMGSVWNLT